MKDVIQEKLKRYNCQTQEDEENAIKEITQEVALYGLMKAGLFEKACFQGGTCLRILHGLDRFSEDLDFALKTSDLEFDLMFYLQQMAQTMNIYGYQIEFSGEDKADRNVRSRFLKDNSIKKLLELEHHADLRKKIQIKVELDIDPPQGAGEEGNYLDFPTDFMIVTHDLPSLFAGKCHALLCRNYVKGRDWYDYLWYLRKEVKINDVMLQNAINQLGPWKNKNISISRKWLVDQLSQKIDSLNWEEVRKDVERFLKPDRQEALQLWSKEFFLKKTLKLQV